MVVLAQTNPNTLTPLVTPSARPTATRPSGKRRLKQSEKNQIVQLYNSGMSTRAVASQLQVSKTTVLGVLKHRGVEVRPRGRHDCI